MESRNEYRIRRHLDFRASLVEENGGTKCLTVRIPLLKGNKNFYFGTHRLIFLTKVRNPKGLGVEQTKEYVSTVIP